MCALAILSLELLNIDTWINSKQVENMTDGCLLMLLELLLDSFFF